jgi:splicing factor 3B subunit 1
VYLGKLPAQLQGVPMTPEQANMMRYQQEMDERNREMTDAELDAMFPEGYEVCLCL